MGSPISEVVIGGTSESLKNDELKARDVAQ